MKWVNSMLVLAVVSLMTAVGVAADKNAKSGAVEIGSDAPTFGAKDDLGKDWKSSDYVGKKIVVVYFYPADMTPGCTKQACGFRDDMASLQAKGIEIVGVSGDSVETHQIFKKEYDLNYTLLADENGEVAKAFGVPVGKGGSIKRTVDGVEKTLTRGVTAKRWTFVIGLDKKIAYKNTKVNAAKDSKAVLDLVAKLTGAQTDESKK